MGSTSSCYDRAGYFYSSYVLKFVKFISRTAQILTRTPMIFGIGGWGSNLTKDGSCRFEGSEIPFACFVGYRETFSCVFFKISYLHIILGVTPNRLVCMRTKIVNRT